jgi:putative ABC transport system ATP-binding protein
MSLLELRDVVKEYRSGDDRLRILDGVSLTVEPGEFVAVYGPSGSGKSTLLLAAAGSLDLDGGSVAFDGIDISALDDDSSSELLRNDVTMVFQDPYLLGGISAVDNAALALLPSRVRRPEARRRALPLLERVGLGARMGHRPHQLSGGERQRVAIARALVTEPRLVLADEPTGNLDARTAGAVLTLLSELCRERGTAAIVATHDPAAADVADRVHELRDGVLRERVPTHTAV